MAINFPNNPVVNETFTVGPILYKWDGASWNSEVIPSFTINENIILAQIAPGETITAGTFVDYLPGNNLNFANASQFNNARTLFASVTTLGNDKIVIAYRDEGNSNYGTAIVGTINGTSITWGNEFVFNSSSTNSTSIAALGTDKIVIAYEDVGNLSYGTVIVGTVNGTSITWSNEFVFNSAYTFDPSINVIGTSKIAVVYSSGASSLGTARVGTIETIDGISITWGTQSVFSNRITLDFDAAVVENDKIVVAYPGSSNEGTARIGTVSGNSISWSSESPESVFNNSGTTSFISVTALEANKVVIAYSDAGNSNYGTAIIGTIDGNSIIWSSEFIFNSADTRDIDKIVPENNKIVITYRDFGNASYGAARVGTIDGTSITWSNEFVFNSGTTISTSIAAVGIDRIIVAYRDDNINSSFFNKGIVKIGEFNKLITNTSAQRVFGLAKTSGTNGQTIQVYTNV